MWRPSGNSHWPDVTPEHLKCGSSTLRYAVSVKYTLGCEDLALKKNESTSLIISILIKCGDDTTLDRLGSIKYIKINFTSFFYFY